MQRGEYTISTVEHAGGAVRVAQLTDTHLCDRPGGTLLSMDTDHSLQAVIDLVNRRDALPDVVLGTGDMADRGARGAYERLGGYFRQLGENCYFMPGNHDDREQMVAVLGEFPALASEIRVGDWQILMLDSQIPGEVGGRIGAGQLERLRAALASGAAAGLYSLVCMHHQPVPVGCPWLDEQMIADADELFTVLDQSRSVRGLLWGHVHQEIDRQRRGVRLMASPSTCVQFLPGTDEFVAEDLPPGYRWLELQPDGRIDTEVLRAASGTFTVNLAQRGYLER